MAPTTEIFIFEANDAYHDDPKLIFGTFNIVLQAQGVHPPAYYGKQIANSSITYIFLDWDNYEAHATFMNSPSYDALVKALTACLSNTRAPEMYHVQFSAPTTALQQPVTEVRILTLKKPENRAAVVDTLSKTSENSGRSLVFGVTREDEKKYFIVRGWQSVEEYKATVAKPEVVAALDELYALVDDDHLHHTSLLQYRRS